MADVANGVPAGCEAWRQGRWEQLAGANGKADIVANAKINDPGLSRSTTRAC
ncbi:hypothetical protein SAMN05660976_01725 [Nonomuraea pusilla]|uniref:Uncharacterized protein n=2 Tax=Nonomuraea pusilla TaxID=46177 RepID=A0A1H7M1M6_9ACTN|nr:hypothetical protein SAMN05660976_01725 [Nonomuraea pusilla]